MNQYVSMRKKLHAKDKLNVLHRKMSSYIENDNIEDNNGSAIITQNSSSVMNAVNKLSSGGLLNVLKNDDPS